MIWTNVKSMLVRGSNGWMRSVRYVVMPVNATIPVIAAAAFLTDTDGVPYVNTSSSRIGVDTDGTFFIASGVPQDTDGTFYLSGA